MMLPTSRLLLLSFIVLAAISLPNSRASGQDAEKLRSFFIFLTTGRSTAGVEKEEVQKMQKMHIENFVAQAKRERLFAAGPVADPNKTLRGIVGVRATDIDNVPDLFREDPYVEKGFMKLETSEIVREIGKFEMILDEVGMEEHRLALFTVKPTNPKPVDAELDKQWEYWQLLVDQGDAAVALQFSETSPRYSVVMLKKTDDASVQSLVSKSPLMQSNKLDCQIIPLYVSKGVLNYRTLSK